MIFNLYSRVAVKVGDGESHVFDRGRLMYTEVAEIEKVTGLSYADWAYQLGQYSITAVAALIHVLRKREGQPSDFGSMQFNAAELDVVPLKDDGTEYTPQEVAADLKRRLEEAKGNGADPTLAAVAAAVTPEASQQTTNGTSLCSPNGSPSAPGNGISSPGPTSSGAKPISTPS